MSFNGADFYAALIHELKNELNLLALAIEGIPRHDAVHDQAVDGAQLLCQRVTSRLQQALLVYKSSSQPIHPHIDAWSPADVVGEIADRARGLAHGRLRVEAVLAPDLPALGFFDRDLVEMALINAVHNSLAHAKSRLDIEARVEAGYLVFTVRDDSPGYPEAILLGGATMPRSGGTGLGLQFARLIAESHDNAGRRGELRLANDGGAVFSLRLP